MLGPCLKTFCYYASLCWIAWMRPSQLYTCTHLRMQQNMHVWLKDFKFTAKTVTTMAVGRARLATVSTLHALQQKQRKKQKTSPHDKFKALDKESRERRRLRKHMRVKRSSSAAQPASKIRNSKLALKRFVSRPGSKNSHNKASIALTTAKQNIQYL